MADMPAANPLPLPAATSAAPPTSYSSSFEPRTYQLEMSRLSEKENIVVTMDTGSGKTGIALLRISAAFREASSAGRLAWFLCPSVALAEQQAKTVSAHLGYLSSVLLTGNDGVERWGGTAVWDAVLAGRQIVVSTYQVLLDALQHGFVQMDRLLLLVVDEAHNCHGRSPLSRIMHDFYHPRNLNGGRVPAVLGLTASPVVRSSVATELSQIERNLNSVCRSPKISREDLLRHTKRPKLCLLAYSKSMPPTADDVVSRLLVQYEVMDMSKDPWVIQLLADGETSGGSAYTKAFFNRKTYVCGQLRSLISNVEELHKELGPWASRRYMTLWHIELWQRLKPLTLNTLQAKELGYMTEFFDQLSVPLLTQHLPPPSAELTNKVQELIGLLLIELKDKAAAGIVFVKTRATVRFLASLLAHLTVTKDLVRVGSFVGLSNNKERVAQIGDEIGKTSQNETGKADRLDDLNDLRNGIKNLVVCTNAAEEGIDISACNFVICFDSPQNLKSFIQRRGRARSKDSKYVIMYERDQLALKQDWLALEKDMKRLYDDEMRERQEIQRLELESKAPARVLVSAAPGSSAKLTSDDAVAHLEHFCAKLPSAKFAEKRPLYSYMQVGGDVSGAGSGLSHMCTVELPNSMDKSLRVFQSSRLWTTERLAKSDAAFEAYQALYRAGLVNDNLLPEPKLDIDSADVLRPVDKRDGLVEVALQKDPLEMLAELWTTADTVHRYAISFSQEDGSSFASSAHVSHDMMLGLPLELDEIEPLTIYWNETTKWTVTFRYDSCVSGEEYRDSANKATHVLLWSVFQSRMSQHEHGSTPVLFFPRDEKDALDLWIHKVSLQEDAQHLAADGSRANQSYGFGVRQRGTKGKPCEYLGESSLQLVTDWRTKTEEQKLCLKVKKLPSRTDFMHPVPAGQDSEPASTYYSVDNCIVESMPIGMSRFALLIPSIMHHIGKMTLFAEIMDRISIPEAPHFTIPCLKRVDLMGMALSAPAAREPTNYERLEFLGDAVLGFCAVTTLTAKHSKWHEGYLARAKDHVVTNTRLARAAVALGLAPYIIGSSSTFAKWAPPSNDELIQQKDDAKRRSMSTKTLADVVEALIGAASTESSGGSIESLAITPQVLSTLKTLLPSVTWMSYAEHITTLREHCAEETCVHPNAGMLEELIGYRFKRPSLLVEALTHPSDASSSRSYQRLEFLGDSVLQILVTRFIMQHDLPVSRMHLLRTAAVNNQFLAFMALCMQVKSTRSHVDRESLAIVEQEEHMALHNFLIHGPSQLFAEARAKTIERFELHREIITQAIEHGLQYPWAPLSSFAPEKLFSDIVESTIAAIYIDSGDERACNTFIDKLGIYDFLSKAIAANVKILQPKAELGIVAGQEKVTYAICRENAPEIKCNVSIGARVVGEGFGRQRIEAEVLAAAEALRKIYERGSVEAVESGTEVATKKRRSDSSNGGNADTDVIMQGG